MECIGRVAPFRFDSKIYRETNQPSIQMRARTRSSQGILVFSMGGEPAADLCDEGGARCPSKEGQRRRLDRTSRGRELERERELVGLLTTTYKFKVEGLVKKVSRVSSLDVFALRSSADQNSLSPSPFCSRPPRYPYMVCLSI